MEKTDKHIAWELTFPALRTFFINISNLRILKFENSTLFKGQISWDRRGFYDEEFAVQKQWIAQMFLSYVLFGGQT